MQEKALAELRHSGSKYLVGSPDVIRPVDLEVFPEFVAFISKSKTVQDDGTKKISQTPANALVGGDTPEELISKAFETLNSELAQQLLDKIKGMPPAFFERLVVELMLRLGYGGPAHDAGMTLGKSGDGGVDGVIKQDKLGLEKIYLQAKRWNDGAVGRKEVQSFVGALTGQGANKGVFITTSAFTKDARDYVESMHSFKVSLVDGFELAHLLIEHDMGVSHVVRYDLKRVDSDFFSDV